MAAAIKKTISLLSELAREARISHGRKKDPECCYSGYIEIFLKGKAQG